MADRDAPKPLQKRVEDYLRTSNTAYIVEEIEDEAANFLLSELREAEKELEEIQNRVARLKELLAKTEFDESP